MMMKIRAWSVSFFGLALSLIASLFVVRLLVDSSFRMLYSFLPQISAGLEISISVFSWILLIRSTSALFSPVLGALADRYGRRNVMVFALLSQTVSMAGIVFLRGWWAAIPIFFGGLAVNSYLPAQQAYISDLVSFERRGRALASVDIAFAISGMLVMPLVGWFFSAYGFEVPFVILGVLSLLGAWAIWQFLPEAKRSAPEEQPATDMWTLLRQKNVQASLGVAVLLFTGVGIFMSFWSIWLTVEFNFDAVDLGLMSTQIGISELFGAIFSGLLVDHLGKRRSSFMGVVLAGFFFALIPFAEGNLLWVRVALVVTVFWVEYSIVSLFPLYGEQAPQARATIFALVALANGVGLAVGPVLATALWEKSSLAMITSAAAFSLFLCAMLIRLFLKEKVDETIS